MQSPTLDVDVETYQLIEHYVNEWILFFENNLKDYNISPLSDDKPEWFRNLEFSSYQRKCALSFLLAGMQIQPLPFSDNESEVTET